MKSLIPPHASLSRPGLLKLMFVPADAIVGVFVYWPLFQGFLISTREWNGYSPVWDNVGLAKYVRMLGDPVFWMVMVNTLVYGFGSTLLQTLLGLGLALLLDTPSLRSKVMRTVVYLPAIISPLIMGYIWRFVFQYSGGALNDIMIVLGQEPQDWLGQGSVAVAIIVLVNSFQYCGVAMIIYLAGLQAIPRDCIESAMIDGAGPVNTYFKVRLPLLMPAITTSTVINLIGGLQLFDVIVALTRGGPAQRTSSISTMVRDVFFIRTDAGYASAMGIAMFLMILVITLVSLKAFETKEVAL